MFIAFLALIFGEVNKNFAHLDEALREKYIKQNIIEKDAPLEDQQMVWFSNYDKDGNLKLDGHEIMFGILHEDIMDEEEKGKFTDYSKSEYFKDPSSLFDEVDTILDTFDMDGDGYILYSEYKQGIM